MTGVGRWIVLPGFVAACLAALVSQVVVRRPVMRELVFEVSLSAAGFLFSVWFVLTGAGCLWFAPYILRQLWRHRSWWTGFGVVAVPLIGLAFLGLGLVLGSRSAMRLWSLLATTA